MSNSTIRARAQSLVRRHWGTMICMLLLIGLVNGAANFVVSQLAGLISILSSELAMIVSILCSIAIGIASCGLSMGYTAALIRLNDDKTVTATDVFSSLGYSLSAFGLDLWMGLRIFVWMLPGLAVVLVGVLLGLLIESTAVMTIFAIIGYILLLIFGIRATYSYAMSLYLYADRPGLGVFGAVNESLSMMNGRRLELFLLTLPYALIVMGGAIVFSLLTMLFAALHEVLVLVFSIVGGIALLLLTAYISLLTTMAYVSFYRAHSRSSTPTATAAADDFAMDSLVNFDF